MLATPFHFARQRSEGGAYRQTRVEAGFTVNLRAESTHARVRRVRGVFTVDFVIGFRMQ